MNNLLAIILLVLLSTTLEEAASIDGTVLQNKVVTLKHFSFQNCGPQDPINIQSAIVSPDPIKIPGTVIVSATGVSSVQVTSAATIHLLLTKVIAGVKLTIPCIDQIGSCDYNVCQLLDFYFTPGTPCPPNLPCHCPIPAGSYSLDNFSKKIDMKLPDIVNGDLSAYLTLNTDTELACINATISVST